MIKVKLIFKSIADIWEFKSMVKVNFAKINIKERSLVCECTEPEIELAIKTFQVDIFEAYAVE